jgi:hypothetical protein
MVETFSVQNGNSVRHAFRCKVNVYYNWQLILSFRFSRVTFNLLVCIKEIPHVMITVFGA